MFYCTVPVCRSLSSIWKNLLKNTYDLNKKTILTKKDEEWVQLAASAEDGGSVPSIHKVAHNHL